MDELKLSTMKTKEYWDYHEVAEYIEAKLGISLRDVAGKRKAENFGKDVPYQNFWHYLCEYNYDLSNGSFIHIGEPESAPEDWQRPICAAFREIVGDDELWVEW